MGERIRQLREKRGVSREWLAEMIKCDPISIECWEDGTMTPKPAVIRRLAAFFKVSEKYITDGDAA